MDAAIVGRIALETAIPESSVSATVALLQNGAAGPFIAHYRKEAVGGLDEAKIRLVQDRLAHYREVLELRESLVKTLTEQEKLTDELRAKIDGCLSKPELDDMHHRFRPRKKTRAIEAVEKGLEPLAEYFWKQEPDGRTLDEHLDVFVDPAKGVLNREQAQQGAVDILAEWIWANPEYRQTLREMLWSDGQLVSAVVPAKVGQKTKYTMYYDRRESVTSIPSHRVLAIRRGCKEGVLVSSIEGDNAKAVEYLLSAVLKDKEDRESMFFPILAAAAKESYDRILRPMIETEVRTQLKERADREAIKVFQENLSNLLLSPPAGPIVVMGADMAKGRECNLAVVDESGRLLESAKIKLTAAAIAPPAAETAAPAEAAAQSPAPVADEGEATVDAEPSPAPPAVEESPDAGESTESAAPAGQAEAYAAADVAAPVAMDEEAPVAGTGAEAPAEAPAAPDPLATLLATLASPAPVAAATAPKKTRKPADPRLVLKGLIARHKVRAIAIGAGTGVRELESLLRRVLAEEGLSDVFIAAVNDAGLAIYSSSRLAREEFPDRSASARCAVSLARRLQDPLAELVKIDPKLIGVGQYQHDVDQKALHRGLVQTVQYCVNNVGVNLNTAGAALLRHVSGLNDKLARRIVAVRSSDGPFPSRYALKSALNLEDAVYEQAAGFLRVPDGENALDKTAVHPESYALVEKMAEAAGGSVGDLVGNKELIDAIKLEDYVTEAAGLPTLADIREELLRPGRDPRRTFKLPRFNPDVRELGDLKPGMTLEGVVTNVTNFGAFVDIGVRQDGLVHLSQMASRFIRDPREAVKVGDVVEVKVISADSETKRIALSMKSGASSNASRKKPRHPRKGGNAEAGAGAVRAGAEGLSRRPDGRMPAGGGAGGGDRRPRPEQRDGDGTLRRNRDRDRKRPPRKPERVPQERTPAVYETAKESEPVPEGPESSFEEKIAFLQSKFRGNK
ncbi:MAG: S1 RNA-binding domain-containing protein [Acidobacteriota bacterium]|jgi:transcriptional accessory protein Tex/SPT6|nr:S1 RNA-binding domain-containing protein [Acidobacteriota bacterium]